MRILPRGCRKPCVCYTTRGLRRAASRGLPFPAALRRGRGHLAASLRGGPGCRCVGCDRGEDTRRHDGRGDRLAGRPNRALAGGMAGPGRGVRYRPAGPERGAPGCAPRTVSRRTASGPSPMPPRDPPVGAAQCRGVRRRSVPRRQGRPAPDRRRPRQRHHGARRGRPGSRAAAATRRSSAAAVRGGRGGGTGPGGPRAVHYPPASGRLQPAAHRGRPPTRSRCAVWPMDDELLHLVRVAYGQNP